MKKKGLGKKILSALLAFSLTVGVIPTGQLVTFAAPAVDAATTQENVDKVQAYADTLLTANSKTGSYANGEFTWDSTGSKSSWNYYNGMMLDAYMLLGNELDKTSYAQFVKNFYDKGNLKEDGEPETYVDYALGSVPMGLALFDLIDANDNEATTVPTEAEIEKLKETPFTVKDGLYDQTKKNEDLGLEPIAEADVVTIYNAAEFTAEDSRDKFVNGVVMTEFKGQLYCQWQSSPKNEDSSDTWVAYSIGTENSEGKTEWTDPMQITKPEEMPEEIPGNYKDGFFSSGGWHVYDASGDNVDDTIIAYINYWPVKTVTVDGKEELQKVGGGYTYYKSSTDGINWSKAQKVLMADNTQLTGIFEQDPHILDSGRIVNAAHFQTNTDMGLWINPIYTDDKSGTSGWIKAEYTNYTDNTDNSYWPVADGQSREMEPSMFVNEYGHLVMTFRDQGNNYTDNYRVLASISTDDGETWSSVVPTNLRDARQKQSAGNLPDGTAYIVSCPREPDKDSEGYASNVRYPLVISLSKDGKTYDTAYVLRTGTEVGEKVVHEGTAKRLGYHYPKSVVIGDSLYVSYSWNKEAVQYIRIPLSKISLIDSTKISKDTSTSLITLEDLTPYDENSNDNLDWEIDNYLRKGDAIFVDRPTKPNTDGSENNKYFGLLSESIIDDSLVGSVYIRTACNDKEYGDTTTPLAKVTANQDLFLYIGLDNEVGAIPSWIEPNGFSETEITYKANSSKIYTFYQKKLEKGISETLYSQLNKGWNYIAMAVPAPNDKYRDAIKYIYSNLTNSSNYTKQSSLGNNYSERNATDITLADVYMAQRFLIECANAVNNNKLELTDSSNQTVSASTIYNDVYTSLKWIGDSLYDATTGLYSQGYSLSDYTKASTYNAKDAGFYAMALVDAIAMMPDGEQKSELITILGKLFDGMLKYQDSDTGMWTDGISSGTDMNFEGSAMMSYALLKAYKTGVLTDKEYGNAGVMAFNGIVASGVLDVATASDEAAEDETNASGIAPLMMASTLAAGVAEDVLTSEKEEIVSSLSWQLVNVPNSEGKYCVVQKMDKNNTNGYIITRYGLPFSDTVHTRKFPLSYNASSNALYSDEATVSGFTRIDEDGVAGNDYYYGYFNVSNEANGITDEHLWLFDGERIYSKYPNSTAYLNADTTTGALTVGSDSQNATIWKSEAYTDNNNDNRSILKTSDEYYLCYTGTSSDSTPESYGVQTSPIQIMLWTLETTPTYAAIDGQTVYSVNQGSTSVSVDSIKKSTKIYASTDKTAENLTEIPWTDPNVEVTWNAPLNTSIVGIYTMTVKYYGTSIGTITVNVGNLEWTDVTDYYYERVFSLESGKQYIFTENNHNSTISAGGSAVSVSSLGTELWTDSNNKIQSSSTLQEVNISLDSDGVKYRITGIDENNNWNYNNSSHLYTTVNGKNYYLLGGTTSGSKIQINSTKSYAVSWTANKYSDSDIENAAVSTSAGYLSFTGDVFTVSTISPITVYSLAGVTKKELSMAGKDSYRVVANENNLTETYIKANTNVYMRTTEPNGVPVVNRIPWTDLKATWTYKAADGTVTENATLNPNVEGTYTMNITYGEYSVGTITVTVVAVKNATYIGDTTVYTALNREPNLSGAKVLVEYSDGSTEEITIENGLEITGYKIDKAGTYQATVSYMGYEFTNLSVVVDSSAYANLPEASYYPEYPADGSVRVKKDAINTSDLDWYDTGVTKVELDVAGVSVKSGVDVILVTDISNSMGRNYPDDYEVAEKQGKPGQKLDEAMTAAKNLATLLLEDNVAGSDTNNSISFVTFGGYDADNSVRTDSYTDDITHNIFEENGKTIGMLDATRTVFVNEQDAAAAIAAFDGTKFITRSTPKDIVQVTDNNGNSLVGINSGGTNYDYAFAEAINAVSKLKEAYYQEYDTDYDASGRQTIVLFMTDGAPTYYNYEGVQLSTDANDYLYGTLIPYPKSQDIFYPGVSSSVKGEDGKNLPDAEAELKIPDGYDQNYKYYWDERSTNWLAFTSNANEYAVTLNSMIDDFYAVGFKMNEDLGTSKHCYNWVTEDFVSVLNGVAGIEDGKNAVNEVVIAENAESLAAAYESILENVTNSGTSGTVRDEVKEEFTLFKGEYIKNLDGVKVENVKPTIDVIRYEIYTSSDKVNGKIPEGKQIGDRTGDYKVLESVWFDCDDDGNLIAAYSDQVFEVDDEGEYVLVDGKKVNADILDDSDPNNYSINAANFTYTYENGGEYFDWYIPQIAGYEYSFSYYAYLEGTNPSYEDDWSGDNVGDPWRPQGVYFTNKIAHLTYVDIDGYKAYKEFPVPKKPWGEAVTTAEYYLVNANGEPVNRLGEVIPFPNRILVDVGNEEGRTKEVKWEGEAITIKATDMQPAGYELHNENAAYMVDVESKGLGTVTINPNGASDTSTVWANEEECDNGDGTYNCSVTTVSFGVLYDSERTPVPTKFQKDQIVMDYGKSINIDVFDNNPNVNLGTSESYSAEVVGFRVYDDNPDLLEYVYKNRGENPYKSKYGTFSIVEGTNGTTVNYKLDTMLTGVEQVFTIVLVTSPTNPDDKYYLLQQLDVIPATVMYYETDFVDGVFTTTQSEGGSAWSEKIDSGEAQTVVTPTETEDPVQNDGTIAVTPTPQTYGFDSTYNDDSLLSDGSSMFVKGGDAAQSAADAGTTASFTFTGTGFDLISRTGAQQGLIQAKIYNTLDNSLTKTISVLNKADSTWGELYQIPVISTEVAYGTYRVDIIVFSGYNNEKYPVLYRGNEFYFDAIRIYDPMGVGSTTDATALEAYKADGQAYPTVSEVREMLIKHDDFDVDISSTDGMLFIEKPVWNADTGKYELGTNDRVSISEYDTIGPNNETYLNSGDTIAFKLTGIDVDNLASVDIGAKSVNGKAAVLKAAIASSGATTPTYQISGQNIASSTQQYYDLLTGISDLSTVVSNGEAYVFITNAGEAGNILSITDIKIAYKAEPTTGEVQIVSGVDVASAYTSWLLYEPDYDIKSAEFTTENCKVFGKANLVVETTQDVETVKITDSLGRPVNTQAAYEDLSDGTRIWLITMTMMRLGEHTYTVTGYGADGSTGEGAEAKISVTYKEGGGWQDAKSIFKTLFYCRILSAKRSSSNKLFGGR